MCRLWKCKEVQPLWNTVGRFLAKLSIFFPYDPPIALLGVYPEELKLISTQKTCTQMFITV